MALENPGDYLVFKSIYIVDIKLITVFCVFSLAISIY